MLSAQQVDQFRTYGCLLLKGHLTQAEVAALRAEFDHAMRIAFVGNEFDGTGRHWIPMMGPAAPSFGRLAGDPRFLHAARQLIGEDDVSLVAVDANRYVGDTSWHADGGPFKAAKFVYYLEPVGARSGALRLIPMSHLTNKAAAFSEAVRASLDASVRDANASGDLASIPAVVLECEPGDVLVFDQHCYHASIGGRSGRPMCTISFYATSEMDEALLSLMEVVEAGHLKQFGATDVSQVLDREWFATQDWGQGHEEIVRTLRRLGRL